MILLVDGDPQLTTADWIQERNDNPDRPQINGVQLYGNIRNDLLSLKKRYDYVIVDCGGEGNRALRSTMVVATDGRSHHHLQDGQSPLKAAVVLVHGNGPQVGLLALQNSTYTEVAPYPLDVLGAESQSMIGYMLIQQLKNLMPSRNVTALLAHHIGSHSCLSGNQPSASSPFLNPS